MKKSIMKQFTVRGMLFAILTSLCLLPAVIHAQQQKDTAALGKIIESQTDNLPALRAWIAAMGFPNGEVDARFKAWREKFPKNPNFPFALGEAYYKLRDRKSFSLLLDALRLDMKDERLSKMFAIARNEDWDLDITRTPNTIDSLKKIVAARPDSSLPLRQYIAVMGKVNDTVVAQFNAWMKQYPKSSAIPYAIAEQLYEEESPKAKPYLLKVVELHPQHAKVWQMLSVDAERWGDQNAAHEYMGKAAAADPVDPSYSFYYAMDFEHTDPARWRTELYALAKRFPNHERGAQGLYWLATRSTDQAEKVKVYEQLRTLYPPDKFNWSSSGMSALYDVYLLQGQTDKARELAKTMGPKDGWPARDSLAKNVTRVQQLVAEKKYAEASQLLARLKTPRYSSFANEVAILKSNVLHESGETRLAYNNVLAVEARTPDVNVQSALLKFGTALGKSKEQVTQDVWTAREEIITQAPAFELGLYTSTKKASLADYKGKVVLLTFWFPGCGPCRGEFPHFENVLKKFKGKGIAYLGINVFPEQDDYVLPFMKGTKYSFTPLRGTADWAKMTYNVRGEPTNFLIDQEGRIVFSNFMINANNERMLELMIAAMLEKGSLAKK